jgi:hypothetical protein
MTRLDTSPGVPPADVATDLPAKQTASALIGYYIALGAAIAAERREQQRIKEALHATAR